MKKIITLFAIVMASTTYAQITELTNGNVGIGVTNPLEKLEIDGNIKAIKAHFTFEDGFPLLLGNSWALNRGNVEFFVKNDANGTSLQNIWNDNTGKTRYLFRSNSTSSSLVMGDENGSDIFKIDEAGLGVNNRVFFHIPKEDSRVIISGWGNDPLLDDYKFVIKNGSSLVQGDIIADNNIGIGTTSFTDGNDTYRLSVDGKVRAHGVKVYTTWADYVFKPDYDLKPLNEVEAFINKNGHLPNVPSEKEVLENGIELGAMNAKLLEKIEELTLYVIEQNKKITEMQSEINTLKNE